MDSEKKSGSVAETKAMMLKLRAQGLTVAEIAKMTNYSEPRVFQRITSGDGNKFKVWTKVSCPWPELRRWLNENTISRKKLVLLMGFTYCAQTAKNVRNRICGEVELRKSDIDKLVQLTGMPYEKLFREEK